MMLWLNGSRASPVDDCNCGDYHRSIGLDGHRTMGGSSDGSPFLRIMDEKKRLSNYKQEYFNRAAVLAVWTLLVPAHDSAPEMLYSTIDGRDVTAEGMERRNVTVTLRVGPKDQPYFDGVVGYGFHVREL
jgi:hypothetical protein